MGDVVVWKRRGSNHADCKVGFCGPTILPRQFPQKYHFTKFDNPGPNFLLSRKPQNLASSVPSKIPPQEMRRPRAGIFSNPASCGIHVVDPTNAHTCTRAHTHTRTRTHPHARKHTSARAHTHTHIRRTCTQLWPHRPARRASPRAVARPEGGTLGCSPPKSGGQLGLASFGVE